jgi:hypothetical protein
MPRRPPGVVGNGGSTIHWPGVYRHVLEQRCTEDAGDGDFWLTEEAENPTAVAAFEREEAARIRALFEERAGEPVHALSYHLPRGMPPPFHQPFPGFGITVTPDDRVSRRIRTSERG